MAYSPIMETIMDSKQTMGQKIRIARLKRGLTQDELATLAGLSRAWINALENDQHAAGLSAMRKLARALKVSILVLWPDE